MTRPVMKRILEMFFLGSSLSLAGYAYKSVDGKNKTVNDSLVSSSDVNENDLIKLNKLKEKSSPVKRAKPDMKKCINESKSSIKRFMAIKSIPGLSVAISHRGNLLWSKGFGFANLEQGSKCQDTTVMRIASISKPMAMLLVAKLVEDGKLDLDEPIYTYLKDKFPRKSWDGKEVNITLRQLTSHMSGIRAYNRVEPAHPSGIPSEDFPEFFLRDHFNDVFEALNIFKNDDLNSKPGSKFLYSTLAWTLVSAVVQCVLEQSNSFEKFWTRILTQQLGMSNTSLDVNDKLILNRANYYYRLNGTGVLMNSPSVDNSYKWAGGGLLSSVLDVNRFGNVMLYSFLGGRSHPTFGQLKGYLKESTVKELWTPIPDTCNRRSQCSGLGWFVVSPEMVMKNRPAGAEPVFENIAFHTGASVGSSSILLILPKEEIVIAMLCNLQEVSLYDLSLDIVKLFLKQLNPSSPLL